jgi:hypothetical protein
MSNIHYFQRYSQRENVITNNTLLLLSQLNRYSPALFESFLNTLVGNDNEPLPVGVQIEQQTSSGEGSIPDGFIKQDSFKIVIETKMHAGFRLDQLASHLNAFEDEGQSILLLISPEGLNQTSKAEIQVAISQYNNRQDKNIQFTTTTFDDLIKCFKESIDNSRDFEMLDLIEDYENFCSGEGILPTWQFVMRALTAGRSIRENFEFNLYYDHAARGYRKHKFLGLYQDKAIRGVGEIVNTVTCNLENGRLTDVKSESGKEVTGGELDRIRSVIPLANERNGYQIERDHRFFLVDRFWETNFRKRTPYPIRRSKYFDLRFELETDYIPESAQEIAGLLNGRDWRG